MRNPHVMGAPATCCLSFHVPNPAENIHGVQEVVNGVPVNTVRAVKRALRERVRASRSSQAAPSARLTEHDTSPAAKRPGHTDARGTTPRIVSYTGPDAPSL